MRPQESSVLRSRLELSRLTDDGTDADRNSVAHSGTGPLHTCEPHDAGESSDSFSGNKKVVYSGCITVFGNLFNLDADHGLWPLERQANPPAPPCWINRLAE